ncbi:MAG: SpoIIE family protein phosphatase [Hahellaceae bacterium]|nr:SpoIIE family protein phosphatase [Hahellaceae bacterium]
MRFSYAAFTSAGSYYEENQDCILIADQVVQTKDAFLQGEVNTESYTGAKFVRVAVSDGVSGLPAAASASRNVCEQLEKMDRKGLRYPPSEMALELRDALSLATRKNKEIMNGGATLVTAEIYHDFIRLWHAGDSRGYVFSQKTQSLTQITQDHTLLATIRGDAEAKIRTQEFHGTLVTSVENIFVVSPYSDAPKPTTCLPVLPVGDILILCSDGLFENLSNPGIEQLIRGAAIGVEAPVRALRTAVLTFPKSDNISVIALQRLA